MTQALHQHHGVEQGDWIERLQIVPWPDGHEKYHRGADQDPSKSRE
jgi:hypothetical protein